MDFTVNDKMNEKQDVDNLLKVLEKGYKDMEAGRELPLEAAFHEIDKMRAARRNARI